jgi:hypothetical protein
MRSPLLLTPLLLLLPTFLFAQQDGKNVTILDGKIELTVPDRLQPMSDELWHLKYPGKPRAPLALKDADNTCYFIVILSEIPMQESEVAAYAWSQYKQMQKDSAEFRFPEKPHGTIMVNGKKLGYTKFIYLPTRNGKFGCYYFAAVDGRLVGLFFDIDQTKKALWEPVVNEIIQSLKIK